jgi:hypothetical protein
MMDHISDTVERNLAAKLSSSYIIEDKKVTEEICNNSVDEFLNVKSFFLFVLKSSR